jgi:hypothetical protein
MLVFVQLSQGNIYILQPERLFSWTAFSVATTIAQNNPYGKSANMKEACWIPHLLASTHFWKYEHTHRPWSIQISGEASIHCEPTSYARSSAHRLQCFVTLMRVATTISAGTAYRLGGVVIVIKVGKVHHRGCIRPGINQATYGSGSGCFGIGRT